MQVEIKNNVMTITVQLGDPKPSASGKTLVVASSHGNQATTATIQGKPVLFGFTAYIKR
jgi:hypothetical protein